MTISKEDFHELRGQKLRNLISQMTEDFLAAGNTIKRGEFAFAVGCEMKSSVIKAIRRG